MTIRCMYLQITCFTVISLKTFQILTVVKDRICKISVLKCLQTTSALLFILSSRVFTSSQMFPTSNPKKSTSLLNVTVRFMWRPVAASERGKSANETKLHGGSSV